MTDDKKWEKFSEKLSLIIDQRLTKLESQMTDMESLVANGSPRMILNRVLEEYGKLGDLRAKAEQLSDQTILALRLCREQAEGIMVGHEKAFHPDTKKLVTDDKGNQKIV